MIRWLLGRGEMSEGFYVGVMATSGVLGMILLALPVNSGDAWIPACFGALLTLLGTPDDEE